MYFFVNAFRRECRFFSNICAKVKDEGRWFIMSLMNAPPRHDQTKGAPPHQVGQVGPPSPFQGSNMPDCPPPLGALRKQTSPPTTHTTHTIPTVASSHAEARQLQSHGGINASPIRPRRPYPSPSPPTSGGPLRRSPEGATPDRRPPKEIGPWAEYGNFPGANFPWNIISRIRTSRKMFFFVFGGRQGGFIGFIFFVLPFSLGESSDVKILFM